MSDHMARNVPEIEDDETADDWAEGSRMARHLPAIEDDDVVGSAAGGVARGSHMARHLPALETDDEPDDVAPEDASDAAAGAESSPAAGDAAKDEPSAAPGDEPDAAASPAPSDEPDTTAKDKTDKSAAPEAETPARDNLIPIATIEGSRLKTDGPFVPQALSDDPDVGDGSTSREGVNVSPWRLHTLEQDRLGSISEPGGSSRKARKERRFRRASRKARSEKGRKTRKYVRVVVGFMVAALVAGIAAAGIGYVYEQWGGKTVPEVIGLSQTNATQALEEKGLKVVTETTPSDTVDGHVVAVSPEQGTRVDDGSEVRLTIGVSRTIPEVVGRTREEARVALEAAGAQNIHFKTQTTVEDEDKVLEVSPGAGAVFMSTDEVTVVVSKHPLMIDVVGQKRDEALLHLEKEGIAAHPELERTSVEQRLLVLRTTPEAGQAVDANGATVYVGDPLVEVPRVEDYFDATAPHIQQFLQESGYNPTVGYRTQDNRLMARFTGAANVAIAFVPQPWSHAIDTDKTGFSEVMDDSAVIEGVRLTIPFVEGTEVLGIKNPSVGEATANDIMKVCGLEDLQASCTQSNITLPSGTASGGHTFYCCYGESATHTWTILIIGTSTNGKVVANKAVVTCAPVSTYKAIDLSKNGNKICDYVAYQDVYL